MTSKTQTPSHDGCWTCRVRRKKCDQRRPVCDGCAALEIDCLFSDTKPAWMDNGPRQKARADELKNEVKNRAAWRREQRYVQGIETGAAAISLSAGADGEHILVAGPRAVPPPGSTSTRTSSPSSGPPMSSQSTASETPASELADVLMAEMPATVAFGDANATGIDPRFAPFVPTLAPPSLSQERELMFIMRYLDYVFPFLYPFYRPSVLGSGRGWLLVLLLKNKAVFHSALSLASYFFAVSISQYETAHVVCKIYIAEELHKQQELSLHELQRNIGEISRLGVRGRLAESSRAVQGIIQLLYVEAVTAPMEGCYAHLDAALFVFEQIMENHGKDPTAETDTYSWRPILAKLASFPSTVPHSLAGEIYNADQGALRFHTAVLLYIDIIASTTTESPPRLRKYHAALVQPAWTSLASSPSPPAAPGDNTVEPYLDIAETMGIQNWVLLGISEVSALASWKKEAATAKKLSVAELIQRAGPIETELRGRLECLETRMDQSGQSKENGDVSVAPAEFVPYCLPEPGAVQRPPNDASSGDPGIVSLIWGYAALTYHLVVVNGWQPESNALRQSADRTLQLIRRLPSSSWLRTVAWPLCVAGCLATKAQEPMCREIVARVCVPEVFGSVQEALHIMEAVWAQREAIEHGTTDWDLAKCFHVLGRRAFMV